MKAEARETNKYALGIALIVGLVIGGGTTTGLITDTIVQLVVIIAAAIEFSRPSRSAIGWPVFLMSLLIITSMIVQILPLPASVLNSVRPALVGSSIEQSIGDPYLSTISLGVGRTVEAILFVVSGLAFFLAVMHLRPQQVMALLPFFFVGVACNALAGALQYSIANEVSIDRLLPYAINAGFFANVNHFSSLLFITVPLLAYSAVIAGHVKTALSGVTGILVLLLAAGSRAGVAIGLAIGLLSLVFLVWRARFSTLFLCAVFLTMSVYGLGAWTKFDLNNLDPEFGRAELFRTTMSGIWDNWILGTGYGTFPSIYQIYERQEMIFRSFANHAHNDFLEISLEGGILACSVTTIYLGMLFTRFWGTRSDALRRMAFLSLTFLLVHSLVDYPLRTMALALSFALLNAIVFHSGSFARKVRPAIEVEHDGDRILVPIDDNANRHK